MVKSMAKGKFKVKKAKRGEGGCPSLKDQSRNDSSRDVDKGSLLAHERSREKSALQDNRRILGAQTSKASGSDGGESEVEAPLSPKVVGGINVGSSPMQTSEASQGNASAGLASISPKANSDTIGSAPNSPKAVGVVGAWAKGSPKLPTDFQRVVPAFLNPEAETEEEIAAFDLSRFFIEIHKSKTKNVDDIITKASYMDAKNSDKFKRVTPRAFKVLKGVFVAYMTFAESIPEDDAKRVMEGIASEIMKPKYSLPLFRGVDTAGQITTTSRNKIDSVFYFSGKHNPDDLIEVIKKIITNNEALSTILGCSATRLIRSQLQLTDCLGIFSTDLVRGVAQFSRSQAAFHFKPLWHMLSVDTPNMPILTCNDCFLTITHLEDDVIPESFEAPTMSGDVLKTVRVKKVTEYTNPRAPPVGYSSSKDSAPNAPGNKSVRFSTSSENKLFKTRLCRQQVYPCPYGDKCLFAHGDQELRGRPMSGSDASNTTTVVQLATILPEHVLPPVLNSAAITSTEMSIIPTGISISIPSPIVTNTQEKVTPPLVSTDAVLPLQPIQHQHTTLVIDPSPSVPSAQFRAALKPNESRTPVATKRSMEDRSAEASPTTGSLTFASQPETPVTSAQFRAVDTEHRSFVTNFTRTVDLPPVSITDSLTLASQPELSVMKTISPSKPVLETSPSTAQPPLRKKALVTVAAAAIAAKAAIFTKAAADANERERLAKLNKTSPNKSPLGPDPNLTKPKK